MCVHYRLVLECLTLAHNILLLILSRLQALDDVLLPTGILTSCSDCRTSRKNDYYDTGYACGSRTEKKNVIEAQTQTSFYQRVKEAQSCSVLIKRSSIDYVDKFVDKFVGLILSLKGNVRHGWLRSLAPPEVALSSRRVKN